MTRTKAALITVLLLLSIFLTQPVGISADPDPPNVWHAHIFIINCSDASFSAGAQVAQNVYNTLESVNGSVIEGKTVYIHIHWINNTSSLGSTLIMLANDTTSLIGSGGFGPVIFYNTHGSNLPIPEPENEFIDRFLYNDPSDTYVSVDYPTPKPTWWSYLNSWGQQVRDHGWVFVNVIGYAFRNLTNTAYDYNSDPQSRWGVWANDDEDNPIQGWGPYPLDEMGLKSFLGPAEKTVPNNYNNYIYESGRSGSRTGTGSSIALKWLQTFPSEMSVSYPLELLPDASVNFSVYAYNEDPYVAGLQIGGGMYVHAGFRETGTPDYADIGKVAAICGLEAGWRLSFDSDDQLIGSLAVNVYNDTALTQRVLDRYVVLISNASSGQLIINQTTWCPQVLYYLEPGEYRVEVVRFFVTYNSRDHSIDVIPVNGETPVNVGINSGETNVLNAVVPVKPTVPVSLSRGTYVFVIQCRDAPSWWIGDIDLVVEGFDDAMKKAGTTFDLIYVNTTQQLYNFTNNLPVKADDGSILRPGFEYRLNYSVFMNGHGEAVPIPSQFVLGTNPNWESYFDFIRGQIKKYCWIWISITGYPFYYVSNHAYNSSWSTWNVPGLYRIGSSGVDEFLDSSTGDLYWEDYSLISVVSQITHDFWVASKAFNVTGIDPLVLGYRPFPEDPPSGYTYALNQYIDLVGGQKAAMAMEMGDTPKEGYFVHQGVSRHTNDTLKGKIAGLNALWVWFTLGLTWITVVPIDPPASGISIFVWLWNGTWLELLDNITLPVGYVNYSFYFVPPYTGPLRYTAMIYYDNVYNGSNSVVVPRGGMKTIYVNTWKAPQVVSMPEFDPTVFILFLLIGASIFLRTAKGRRLIRSRRAISVIMSTLITIVVTVAAIAIFYTWYMGWLGKYTNVMTRSVPSTQEGYEIQLFSPISVATSGTQTVIVMHYLNVGPETRFIDAVYVDGNPVPIADPTKTSQDSNYYLISWNPMPSCPETMFLIPPVPGTMAPQLYIVLNYYQPQKQILVKAVTSDGHSAVCGIYVPGMSVPSAPWWDSKYDYRKRVMVVEPNKLARTYEPVEVGVTFPQGHCYNKSTIRVAHWDGSVWTEIPSQVYDVTTHGDNTVNACTIIWNVNVELDAAEYYYIYYDKDGEVSPPSYTGLSTPSVVNRGTTFNLATAYGTGDTIKVKGTYNGAEKDLVWINLKTDGTIAWDDWILSPGIFHLWVDGSDVFAGGATTGEANTGMVCEHAGTGTRYGAKGNAASIEFQVVGPLMHRIKITYTTTKPYGSTLDVDYSEVFTIYYTPDHLTSRIKVGHKQGVNTAFTEESWGDWAHLNFPAWDVTPTQTKLAYRTSSGTVTKTLSPGSQQQYSDWTERWIQIFDDVTVEPALGLFFMSDDQHSISPANYRVMNVGGGGNIWGIHWFPYWSVGSSVSAGTYNYEFQWVAMKTKQTDPIRNEYIKAVNPVSTSVDVEETRPY